MPERVVPVRGPHSVPQDKGAESDRRRSQTLAEEPPPARGQHRQQEGRGAARGPTRSQGQGSKIRAVRCKHRSARNHPGRGSNEREREAQPMHPERESGPGKAPAEGRPRADQEARQSQDQTAPPGNQRSAVSARATRNTDRRKSRSVSYTP